MVGGAAKVSLGRHLSKASFKHPVFAVTIPFLEPWGAGISLRHCLAILGDAAITFDLAARAQQPVCAENSNPDVLMVKTTEHRS